LGSLLLAVGLNVPIFLRSSSHNWELYRFFCDATSSTEGTLTDRPARSTEVLGMISTANIHTTSNITNEHDVRCVRDEMKIDVVRNAPKYNNPNPIIRESRSNSSPVNGTLNRGNSRHPINIGSNKGAARARNEPMSLPRIYLSFGTAFANVRRRVPRSF